jgi:hypothetical protein
MTKPQVYRLISDEEIDQIQNGDLATLKAVKCRTDAMDLFEGRLEGLKDLLETPEVGKTMSNEELEYAITEVQIIRDCLEVDQ